MFVKNPKLENDNQHDHSCQGNFSAKEVTLEAKREMALRDSQSACFSGQIRHLFRIGQYVVESYTLSTADSYLQLCQHKVHFAANPGEQKHSMPVCIERGAFYNQRHDFPVTFAPMVLHSLRVNLTITTELIIMIQIHAQISP